MRHTQLTIKAYRKLVAAGADPDRIRDIETIAWPDGIAVINVPILNQVEAKERTDDTPFRIWPPEPLPITTVELLKYQDWFVVEEE